MNLCTLSARAGAKGYIMKQEAPEKVVIAIRRVLQGNIYASNATGDKMLNKLVLQQPRCTVITR